MPLVESKINSLSLEKRFWSNKRFIRRKVQFFLCLQHSSNRQVYLLLPDRGNHQEFLQNSYLKQDSLIHQLRLSAFPSRRVSHSFSLTLKLFFHLVTWQYFFYQKKKDNSNHIYLVTHFILCSAQMVSKIHLQNQKKWQRTLG